MYLTSQQLKQYAKKHFERERACLNMIRSHAIYLLIEKRPDNLPEKIKLEKHNEKRAIQLIVIQSLSTSLNFSYCWKSQLSIDGERKTYDK